MRTFWIRFLLGLAATSVSLAIRSQGVAKGTCGNLNHIDTYWAWPQGTAIEQHRIASILGASVCQAYKHLTRVAAGPLRAKSQCVELELLRATAEEVEKAKHRSPPR